MSGRSDRIANLVARINAQLAGKAPLRYVQCERCGRVVRVNAASGLKRSHQCPHAMRCRTVYRVTTRTTEIACKQCRETAPQEGQ